MNTLHDKFTAASDEYMSRLAMENLSPKTLTNYKTTLDLFGAFLAEQEQPDEFAAVAAWKRRLFVNGLSPATIRQYLVTLEIFFKAASHRSYPAAIRFEENPVDKTLLPKVPERPYEQVLTDEQVIKLFRNTPPSSRFKATWARNWAMLMLCVNEKIRNAELLDLKLSDIDMYHHVLTVQSGKGRKWREVDLCDLTEYALEQYLDSGIRPAYLNDDDYLFGTTAAHEKGNVTTKSGAEKWHRGTGVWLSNVIERTVREITGVPACRSHDLRHVGARVCLNAGQSIEELQGQLGHSQISTTQIYTSRMGSRRARDSARAVLAAREQTAAQLKNQNRPAQEIIQLYA